MWVRNVGRWQFRVAPYGARGKFELLPFFHVASPSVQLASLIHRIVRRSLAVAVDVPRSIGEAKDIAGAKLILSR